MANTIWDNPKQAEPNVSQLKIWFTQDESTHCFLHKIGQFIFI